MVTLRPSTAVLRPVSLLLTPVIASSVQAQPGPQDVGEWTVAVSKDGKGCFLTREFDRAGDTTLLLGIDTDGTNHLTLLNANWSIRPKDRLKLTFRLSKGAYPGHFAIGLMSDGKPGFVTSFEPQFPTYFANSRTLEINRGDVPVERLNLDGSGAAIVALRRCVETQRSRPVAAIRDKPRTDDIPKDPFAPSSKRKRRQ